MLASGLLFDTRLLGEDRARARILGLEGSAFDVFRSGPDARASEPRARESGDGPWLIVRFAEDVRTSTHASSGTPLVRYGSIHASAPLEDDERSCIDGAHPGTVVVVVEGAIASVVLLDEDSRIDISEWLDVTAFETVEDVQSLGAPPTAPVFRLAPEYRDVRKALQMAPLEARGAALLEALREQRAARTEGSRRQAPERGAASRGLSLLARVTLAVSSLLGLLGLGSPREARTPTGRALPESTAPDATLGPPGASWFSRLLQKMEEFARRALAWSELASVLGRKHAEYLERMVEMFDKGDLDSALLHAIPLSDEVAKELGPLPLRTPSPRADLEIAASRHATGSGLSLAPNLFELLRAKYRAAFERLAARGDIEKAAFVLAELLLANEEAVSFLERHGRLRLAAEIAEARGLAPPLVVRQWFLAGDRARAIRLARRHGAFAEAVARLEPAHKEEANALRLLWANTLAQAGAYAAAVDAALPVPAARALCIEWIDRAIAASGTTGARMLVRKVRLVPSEFTSVLDRTIALLQGDVAPSLVHAMGSELLGGPPSDETRVLSKVIARELLARSGDTRDTDQEAQRLMQALVEASGDAVLRADVQALRGHPRKPPKVDVKAVARSVAGEVRSLNEDACVATYLVDPHHPGAVVDSRDACASGLLLGVFDGMGGGSAGDHASDLAKQSTLRVMREAFTRDAADVDAWSTRLGQSLELANHALYTESTTNPLRRGAGCTATVATLSGSTLIVAHVGETRAYLLRKDRLVQITADHTLLMEMVRMGKLQTQAEIDEWPHRNVVVRALGTQAAVTVDLLRVELRRGDIILLCSDGLSSVVSEAAIFAALSTPGVRPGAACDALVAAARGAGAPDNVSVVVATASGTDLPEPGDGPVEIVPFDRHDRTALAARPDVLRVHRAKDDTGRHRILDAAELADGRFLVALGEIGVWILSANGDVIVRFGEPAHRLVLSDHGDRAIAIAFRGGEVARLARIDLVERRARPWCDAKLDTWAADFDGSVWFVARGETLFAIDALSSGWDDLFRQEERGATVAAIARDDTNVSALFSMNDEAIAGADEIWTFDAAPLTLRRRRQVPRVPSQSVFALSPDGTLASCARIGSDQDQDAPAQEGDPGAERGAWDARGTVHDGSAWAETDVVGSLRSDFAFGPLSVTDAWLSFVRVTEQDACIFLCDAASRKRKAVFELACGIPHPGHARWWEHERFGHGRFAGLRFGGGPARASRPGRTRRTGALEEERVVVFDAYGRLLVMSLVNGTIVREFRI